MRMASGTRWTFRAASGIASLFGAIAGALVVWKGSSAGFLLVTAAVVPVVIFLLVIKQGMESLLLTIMGIGTLTVGMNSLRVGGVLTVSDVVLLSALILVALARLTAPKPSYLPLVQPLLLSTSTILVAGFLGNLLSASTFSGMVELFRFTLSTVGVLLLLAVWRPDHQQLRLLVLLFVAGASASAIGGLFSLRDPSGRLLGFTVHSNHFGMLMLLAIGATLGLGLSSSGWARRLAAANFLLLSAGLMGSGSRAAFVGYVVLLAVFLLATRSWAVLRWSSALGTVLLFLAFSGFSLPETTAISRLLGKDSTVASSDSERADARQQSLSLIDASPITGSGFAVAKNAHDLYLSIWTGTGVLGLLAFLALALLMIRRLLIVAPHNSLAVGMLSAYAGYLVAAFFSTIFWDRYLWIFLAMSWLLSFNWDARDTPRRPTSLRGGAQFSRAKRQRRASLSPDNYRAMAPDSYTTPFTRAPGRQAILRQGPVAGRPPS